MFTTWHGNFQEHHRIVLWFWLNANMFLWIEEKDNFDLKTRISKFNQNKNRATTFWKASLDSKWLLMRVTAASLRVNTSLAKLVSRQNFFLIKQVFLTRLENWRKSNTIGKRACLHLLKAGCLWMTVLISYSQDWRRLLLTISPIPLPSLLPPPPFPHCPSRSPNSLSSLSPHPPSSTPTLDPLFLFITVRWSRN